MSKITRRTFVSLSAKLAAARAVTAILALAAILAAASIPACQQAGTPAAASLESGAYVLSSKVQRPDEKEDRFVQELTLTNKDGAVTITAADKSEFPIIGTLKGSEFKAHVEDAGGPVDLVGRMTAKNRVEGELSGAGKDGTRTIKGTFTLVRTSETAPAGGEAKPADGSR